MSIEIYEDATKKIIRYYWVLRGYEDSVAESHANGTWKEIKEESGLATLDIADFEIIQKTNFDPWGNPSQGKPDLYYKGERVF